MKKFYMLWVRAGGGSPTVQHPTKEAALKEAARLTTKGREEVYVLEAIEVVSPAYNVTITPLSDPK